MSRPGPGAAASGESPAPAPHRSRIGKPPRTGNAPRPWIGKPPRTGNTPRPRIGRPPRTGAAPSPYARARSSTASRNFSHASICDSSIHSFAVCACAMSPGPHTIVRISAAWNWPPSVP